MSTAISIEEEPANLETFGSRVVAMATTSVLEEVQTYSPMKLADFTPEDYTEDGDLLGSVLAERIPEGIDFVSAGNLDPGSWPDTYRLLKQALCEHLLRGKLATHEDFEWDL